MENISIYCKYFFPMTADASETKLFNMEDDVNVVIG